MNKSLMFRGECPLLIRPTLSGVQANSVLIGVNWCEGLLEDNK